MPDWTIDEQVTLNAKGAVGSILGVYSIPPIFETKVDDGDIPYTL